MSATIIAQGLDFLDRYLELAPSNARTAARIAINRTAERKGLRAIRDLMKEETAFPDGYLENPKRLGVTKRASNSDLEAIITGRSRPTSLARFASGAAAIGNRGGTKLSVRVNPSRRRTLSRAFLVRLRAGQGPVTDEAFNLGLAVRLAPGETISNKKQMVPFGGGLYLLYGPSVDQVFRTVAVDVSPRILDDVADEFFRQFQRLSDG